MDRFDICEAHAVLEWDYNVGGWLRERPSNQRRREATSVQLHRMQFRPALNLSYDNLSEDGKEVYLTNVLRWNLPRDSEMGARIRDFFSEDWLRAAFPAVHTEVYSTALA